MWVECCVAHGQAHDHRSERSRKESGAAEATPLHRVTSQEEGLNSFSEFVLRFTFCGLIGVIPFHQACLSGVESESLARFAI